MAAFGCGFNRSTQHSKFYVGRRSVADEAETEDLLHGSPEGIDVGSLGERRNYGVELRVRLTQVCMLTWTTSSHAFPHGFRWLEFRRQVKPRCKGGSIFSANQHLERLVRIGRRVLQGPEQTLRIRIVVTDRWTTE